ncbi:LCP family protein [Anaerovoracaceae bacterium 42-11]
MKYVCMAAGLIVVILILTFPALFFKRFKNSRRIISLIISIALIGAYGAGIVYINGTIDFMDKVTTVKEQTEPYYVLAKADSAYDGAESVRGKTVQTFLTNEINYSEAKNMLQEETRADYEMIEDLSALASGVLDETYELIFISEAHYTTMCSENTNFKEGSKIIHTVKVPIEVANIAKDVNVTEDSFNIYVSGLDTEGAIDVVSRSDVNMIVTVNPKAHKVLLTSIPRDYYLELPNTDGAKDKLTHTGVHGINETVAAIEKLTGLDMNYYVKVNYTTVTSLVDAIGGIDVESDYTFVTHGMGVYYEFYEGSNYLDGARALAFARERKSFSDGDLQRNKNQQKVLEGILKKALSSTTILTRYTAILDAIEDCVEINMSQEDIRRLIKMQTDGMPSWDIEKQSIVGVSSSEVCYLDGMNIYASVVLQNPESIVSAVDRIIAVMEDGRE